MNSPPWDGDDWVPPEDEWAEECSAAPAPTAFVAEILDRNTRAAAHWRGRGKANGDQSARGYDVTIAADIYGAGGDDNDARSAVLSRPSGHALSMPAAYLDDVLRAARALKEPPKEDGADDLITRVVLYRTDPPTYELTVGGVMFATSAAVIVNRGRMLTRIVEATNTLPTLPKKGYDRWVAALLARAEIIEQPEDASEEGGVMCDLAYMIQGLSQGDDVDAMERGCIYVTEEGAQCLALRPFMQSVRTQMPQAGRSLVTRLLRRMGWEPVHERVGPEKKQVRVWRRAADET